MQIEINIPEILISRFGEACKKVKRNKEDIIRDLMNDFIEDLEDYEEAIKSKNSNNKTYSLEEIKAKYGLEN